MKKFFSYIGTLGALILLVLIVTISTCTTVAILTERYNHDLINCTTDNPRAIISIEGKTIDVYVIKLYEDKENWKIYTTDGQWYQANKQNVIFYGKDE